MIPTSALEHQPNTSEIITPKEHARISSMIPVFLFIAIVALLGNLLVVFLFIRNRSWLKKAHNNLILALAITDILTAVCILTVPLFIHKDNVYSVPRSTIARELYCRLVWSHYLVFSLGVTSVYTCLFLAFERWLAIGKPLFYKQHLHSKRNIALMVVLPWVAGFAFESSAILRTTGVVHVDGTTGCRWNPDTSGWSARVTIAVVSFLGMIMIPGLLVVVTYIHISIKVTSTLTGTSSQSQRSREASKQSKNDSKRVTFMAGIASIALIICWLPDQIYFMLGQMGYVPIHGEPHRWLNVLALSNTCLNPFIYAFSNRRYREGFKAELAMFLCLGCHRDSYSLSPPESRSRIYSRGVAVVGRRDEVSPTATDV